MAKENNSQKFNKVKRPDPLSMVPLPKLHMSSDKKIKKCKKVKKEEITESKRTGHQNGIITAKQDNNGEFIVLLHSSVKKLVAIPLIWYIALLTENRGVYQSLGMAYNPNPGAMCMEIVLHYSVPADSLFMEQIEIMIEKTLEQYDENN